MTFPNSERREYWVLSIEHRLLSTDGFFIHWYCVSGLGVPEAERDGCGGSLSKGCACAMCIKSCSELTILSLEILQKCLASYLHVSGLKCLDLALKRKIWCWLPNIGLCRDWGMLCDWGCERRCFSVHLQCRIGGRAGDAMSLASSTTSIFFSNLLLFFTTISLLLIVAEAGTHLDEPWFRWRDGNVNFYFKVVCKEYFCQVNIFSPVPISKMQTVIFYRTWQMRIVELCEIWWGWSSSGRASGSESSEDLWFVDFEIEHSIFVMLWWACLQRGRWGHKEVFQLHWREIFQAGHHLLVQGSSTTCLSGPGGRPRLNLFSGLHIALCLFVTGSAQQFTLWNQIWRRYLGAIKMGANKYHSTIGEAQLKMGNRNVTTAQFS